MFNCLFSKNVAVALQKSLSRLHS